LAQVSKFARSRLPDGDQLSIQHLVSLERPAHQKQVCRYDAKIYHRFLLHTWSVPSKLMNVSVLKKVFVMRSPLLQQSCNRYLPFSFKHGTPCLPITPFHVSESVPVCALKSPMRTVKSEGDTLSSASFTSSTKA